ncbi:hypothetical protein [Rickettsiales endosymbiont of Stachyamoeba lipophora]|uniref:hypothetical protein n=1 Tax=Rickettsiales endosymbiont of Stachyamoeba lipophora TaxID=2486578 RepID=UPI000F655AE1|nr:hypothetical protein [Rickettsiales endosymbiont of Stachyamoeba lipophora]AZL16411.1 hypothetical protein EF513_07740 [Rickettsiales endosymbiont of Stachyamoeba lipophora]
MEPQLNFVELIEKIKITQDPQEKMLLLGELLNNYNNPFLESSGNKLSTINKDLAIWVLDYRQSVIDGDIDGCAAALIKIYPKVTGSTKNNQEFLQFIDLMTQIRDKMKQDINKAKRSPYWAVGITCCLALGFIAIGFMTFGIGQYLKICMISDIWRCTMSSADLSGLAPHLVEDLYKRIREESSHKPMRYISAAVEYIKAICSKDGLNMLWNISSYNTGWECGWNSPVEAVEVIITNDWENKALKNVINLIPFASTLLGTILGTLGIIQGVMIGNKGQEEIEIKKNDTIKEIKKEAIKELAKVFKCGDKTISIIVDDILSAMQPPQQQVR